MKIINKVLTNITKSVIIRDRKGVIKTDDKTREALQELLRILCEHPELADRITITIRPSKIKQGTDEE